MMMLTVTVNESRKHPAWMKTKQLIVSAIDFEIYFVQDGANFGRDNPSSHGYTPLFKRQNVSCHSMKR